jgi:hypothetical protein
MGHRFQARQQTIEIGQEGVFVGLWETTYTPVHASNYGHGSLYQIKLADGRL